MTLQTALTFVQWARDRIQTTIDDSAERIRASIMVENILQQVEMHSSENKVSSCAFGLAKGIMWSHSFATREELEF